MDWAPLNIYGRRLAIDGIPEYVEHTSKDLWTDWCLEWSTGVLDLVSTGQALSRSQRDAANAMGIEQHQHFDSNLVVRSGSQERVNRWDLPIKAHVNDAASDGDNNPMTR